jgi:AcrR family transcriptional regulator
VVATRTRLSPTARRAQLIQLGLELLGERTLDQVQVEDVAAAAGISKGLVFHYFPTKRDFHAALVREAADLLLAATAPDPALPREQRLRAGLEAFTDFVDINRSAYLALARSAAGDPQTFAVFEQFRAVVCQRIHDELAEDVGAASPPALVRVAVRGWVALAEEAIVEWLRDEAAPRDHVLDLVHDALGDLVAIAAARAGVDGPR